MRTVSYIGLILGLAAMTVLVAWQGFAEIGGILVSSGWAIMLVPLVWIPSAFFNAKCWQTLFAPAFAPSFWQAFYAQWMGRSVNTLLPVASIGGEVVKARALILWGIDAHHASASAVVDKTVQAVTVIVWGVTGVILLVWLSEMNDLAMGALVGFALLGAGVAGFLVVQRAGMFSLLARSAHWLIKADGFRKILVTAEEVDATTRALYREPRRIAAATTWRLTGLVLQTAEVWLAAYLLGYPIGLVEAIMLKSLTSTVSDAAFVVPNSYGVQEGAYVVFGAFVGLPPDAALAISLATRIRELLIDVPGLVFWQHAEARALIKRRVKSR